MFVHENVLHYQQFTLSTEQKCKPQDRRKYLQVIPDKGLISRIFKEFLKLRDKKQPNLTKGKELELYFGQKLQ